MSYTQGFVHDVFVSYAHLDNEPAKPGLDGWVQILVDRLTIELRQRLGTQDVDVWMDYRLEGNEPLTQQLYDAVQASATLLVVLSPAYLKSQWCTRERERFFARIAERKAAGTVFVAQALDVAEKPPELAELTGYSFWVADRSGVTQRVGALDPRDDERFIERVAQMSYAIKARLVALRAPAGTVTQNLRTPSSRGPALPVYVACSTDDLVDQEEALRSYLTQQGVNVVLGSSQSLSDAAEFKRRALEEIERAGVYVQLLSGTKGRSIAAGEPRLPVLLHQLAETTRSTRLLWRSRELDLNGVTDTEHRALLDLARASGFEEFKHAVADASRPPKVTPPPPPPGDSAMVFVNAEPCDRPLARRIGQSLAGQGIDCFWPLANGSPEKIRRDYEDNLLSCDGILWVYGESDAGWVVAQLRHGRRVLGRRERPVAIAIVEGPPPEKSEVPAAIPELSVLNCRNGIEPTVLGEFVERLKALRT
jgi:hypothetical protein